jgi:urease accessory protein UreF
MYNIAVIKNTIVAMLRLRRMAQADGQDTKTQLEH